ncbi:hypothetical protein PMG71_08045 [Roseofilum sp. BLCC_M154]|uniref:Uncharacterized protein n=1 Tax=Roseofilum acuticapitatum BLCC-M154 TaxID=3022444 RepID=A0ABT7ATJ0_9CYAN|nr:hypothetical protein [Roseofilum acuticapitatum]MDJ1169373.1 hypothetical protein [Roseofilum acuticapitatum BLCC-M154]
MNRPQSALIQDSEGLSYSLLITYYSLLITHYLQRFALYEDDDESHRKYDRAIEVFVFTKKNLRPIKPGVSAMTLHNPIRISRDVPFLNDHPHGFALWPKKLKLMRAGNSIFIH